MLAQKELFERKPERGRGCWLGAGSTPPASADCTCFCLLVPFSVSPSPKLSIHPTKKSNPQAKLFTVFYESLKGRGKEKEKGWIWGQRGGGLLQRRRGERGGERKRRQACMRVPSGAKHRRKGCSGLGGSMPEPYRKGAKRRTGGEAEIEVQMDLGPPGRDCCKDDTKGMPGQGTGSGERGGHLRQSC